jgi:hypothetical protein
MSALPKPPAVWRDEDGIIHGLEDLGLCPKCGSSDLWESGAAIQCYKCAWGVDIEYSAPQKPSFLHSKKNLYGKYEVHCRVCGIYKISELGKLCSHDGWPGKVIVTNHE